MKSDTESFPHSVLRHIDRRARQQLFTALWVAGSLLAVPVHAGLPERLAACQVIADNVQRLACYDALPRREGASNAAPATAMPIAPVATLSSAPVEGATTTQSRPSFGEETVQKALDREPESLGVRLTDSIYQFKKGQILHLENGQIWQSVDDHEYVCEVDQPQATIRRNFAGSYWLHLTQCPFNLRVSRVE